ncbi:MAG: alpha/beta hydrolase [Candidatus Binataceae bacterium]
MDAHQFHQTRKFAATPFGRIAYVERGTGPVAMFLHGFPLNGFQWRNVMDDLSTTRRCIAPDMMGLGYSEVSATQELLFEAQAKMLAAFLDRIGVDKVDLTGNDSGGGISQIFAAHFPSRVRTLTLTNCEVHDLWPNPTLRALTGVISSEAARATFRAMLENPDVARNSFAPAYEDPQRIPDEAFRAYLEPLQATDDKANNLRRFFELERNVEQLVAAAPQLRQLKVPTQVVWGDTDVFFDMPASLGWLKQNLPGIKNVITVPGGRVFFPEEHPKLMSVLLREFWRAAS